MRVVLITGMSGSGKSIALDVLEDAGFYCVDNLPSQFLMDLLQALGQHGHDKVAIAVDVRTLESLDSLANVVGGMRRFGHDTKVVFLNARNETLLQRFSETRRRHPISLVPVQQGHTPPTLIECIERERELLTDVEAIGITLDTSDTHPNTLRKWIVQVVEIDRSPLTILFESFAFKQGVPLDADLVFDVRCLPNPHYDPQLRPMTGMDAPVAAFLRAAPEVSRMVEDIQSFLTTWVPRYIQDNRSYLTVAIGCTGGQHRSVYCVEELARRFANREQVLVRHRALAKREDHHGRRHSDLPA